MKALRLSVVQAVVSAIQAAGAGDVHSDGKPQGLRPCHYDRSNT